MKLGRSRSEGEDVGVAPWSLGRDFQLCSRTVNSGKVFSRSPDFLHFFLSFLNGTLGNLLTSFYCLPEVVFVGLFFFSFIFPNPSVSL